MSQVWKSGLNTVRLTVRGLAEVLAPSGCELVEPPATHEEPFDKLRANGIFLKRTVLGLTLMVRFVDPQYFHFDQHT